MNGNRDDIYQQRLCPSPALLDGHRIPCNFLDGHDGPCEPGERLTTHLRREVCEEYRCPILDTGTSSAVWIVFKGYYVNSVWMTKEAAQAHVDHMTERRDDLFIESYPIGSDGR